MSLKKKKQSEVHRKSYVDFIVATRRVSKRRTSWGQRPDTTDNCLHITSPQPQILFPPTGYLCREVLQRLG